MFIATRKSRAYKFFHAVELLCDFGCIITYIIHEQYIIAVETKMKERNQKRYKKRAWSNHNLRFNFHLIDVKVYIFFYPPQSLGIFFFRYPSSCEFHVSAGFYRRQERKSLSLSLSGKILSEWRLFREKEQSERTACLTLSRFHARADDDVTGISWWKNFNWSLAQTPCRCCFSYF